MPPLPPSPLPFYCSCLLPPFCGCCSFWSLRLQHFHGTWGLAPLPYQWMQNKTEFCFAELRSSPAIFWPDVWVKSESSHVCLSQIQSERLLHWSCPNMSVPKVNEAMWHCLANFHLFATHILSLRLKEGSFSALSIFKLALLANDSDVC